METAVDKLEAENVQIKKENENIRKQLKDRETRLQTHTDEINNLEQYTRRNSVRIYGIDDKSPRETALETANQVIKLANNKLSLKITTSDIDIAHRMGRYNKDANRPIICKFVSRFAKHEVIRERRRLKGTPIVIREDLTIQNAKLLEKTSRHDRVQAAWSDEGRIIALLHSGEKMTVDSKTNLDCPPQLSRR